MALYTLGVENYTYSTVETTENSTSIIPDDTWGRQHEPWVEVLINITLWSIWAFTIIGNSLVLLVFAVDNRVRSKVSNLYILNLSLGDFLVGCISIPLNNIYIYRGIWPFGEAVCKFWIAMDFSACAVSVWAVVLISYDRFMLVTKGLDYDRCQTKVKFLILAGIVWSVSIFRNAFAYCIYDVLNEPTVVYDIECSSPLNSLIWYMLLECIISFFLPVSLTTYFNIRLYLDIRRRSRVRVRVFPGARNNTRPASILVDPADQSSTVGSELQESDGGSSSNAVRSSVRSMSPRREGTTDLKKHRRAAVTLGLIVVISSTCWAIYFSITIVTVIFQRDIGSTAYVASYYIYYANSAVNPLLYVATNPNIRRGIARILFLKRR